MSTQEIPNVVDVVRGIAAEVQALDGVEHLAKPVKDNIQTDPHGVLNTVREISGLPLPDSWMPLMYEGYLSVDWRTLDRSVTGRTSLCVLFEPLVWKCKFRNRDEGTIIWGRNYQGISDAGFEVVVRKPKKSAKASPEPALWLNDGEHNALPLDIGFPDYVRALAITRGVRYWPLFFAPLPRTHARYEWLVDVLNGIEQVFGEDVSDQLAALSPNAARNVARVNELRQQEGWESDPNLLCRQPVLVVPIDDPSLEAALSDLDVPPDAAIYCMSTMLTGLKRFDELGEREAENGQEVSNRASAWCLENVFPTAENRFALLGRGHNFVAGYHNLPAAEIQEAFQHWGYDVLTLDDLR